MAQLLELQILSQALGGAASCTGNAIFYGISGQSSTAAKAVWSPNGTCWNELTIDLSVSGSNDKLTLSHVIGGGGRIAFYGSARNVSGIAAATASVWSTTYGSVSALGGATAVNLTNETGIQEVRQATYANGRYFLKAASQTLYSGTAPQAITAGATVANGANVHYGQVGGTNYYIAAQPFNSPNCSLHHSTDLTSWTTVSVPGGCGVSRLAIGQGRVVISCAGTTDSSGNTTCAPLVASSTNLTAFTNASISGLNTQFGRYDIAFGAGKFVLAEDINNNNSPPRLRIYNSSDGTSWSRVATEAQGQVGQLNYTSSKFLLTSYGVSDDGTTWTKAPFSSLTPTVAYGN